MTKSITNAVIFCGNTGVGKSYLCNRIFEHFNSPTRFESSSSVKRVTGKIQQGSIIWNGTTFTIVDTPGFFDNDDPSKTAQVDGANMCTLIQTLESCHQIFALVFMFTDRFSHPHKIWYDRVKLLLTSGRVGHIHLVHNKLGPVDPQVWAQNTQHIQTTVGESVQSSYHWLSYNAPESQIKDLMDRISSLAPFTLGTLAVPEICYQRVEMGPEFEETIAQNTKDEGHMTQVTRDTSHMVTDLRRGERRYGIAGPRKKIYVDRWVVSSVVDKVWVPRMVTRRTVGVYQYVYKVRYDGTRVQSHKQHCRTYEQVS